MTSEATDFTWFTDNYALGLNFCLTFVRGVAPDEVLERLGGSESVELVGARRLQGAEELVPMRPDVVGEDGAFYADRITGLVFAAAAQVGDWAMVVEPNGFLCTQEPIVQALSRTGEFVSLYFNENTDPRFIWARNSVVLVDFDPTAAGWRHGVEPDRLNGVLGRLGFDLSTEEIDPSDPRWRYDELWQARILALMDHLTGVRLTAELLETAVFRCGAVPDPNGWAWVTADPANTAPYTPEGLVAEVRAKLRSYAADPDANEDDYGNEGISWTSHSGWESHGVTDERLIATGYAGEDLYTNDPSLMLALADADEQLHRQVTKWARLWGFTEAEMIDQPWFAAVRRAVEQDEAITDSDRDAVARHLDPLPVGPEIGPDGRLDRGSRHHLAFGLLYDDDSESSLGEVVEALVKAAGVDNDRFDRLSAAVRREFPELRLGRREF